MESLSIKRGGEELFGTVDEAATFIERLVGLTRHRSVSERYAMAFANCPRIHCHGMKVPIDVVTCDRAGAVLDVSTVPPGKLGAKCKGAWWAIECREGAAARLGIEPGQRLDIERRPQGAR